MRIAISGAKGFIGSHLVPALKDDKVYAYGKGKDVSKGFKMPKVDLIIHLAANTSSKLAQEDPRMDFETNVIGTFNMLEQARKMGSKFIFPSTHKTMENEHGARSPYGMSKYVGESYTREWAKTYEVPVIINRMSNLYGEGGDHFFVNHFVKSVVEGKSVEVWGTGRQVRDVIHIDDIVRLFVDQVNNFDKYESPEPLIVGGGIKNALSILELLEYLECKDYEIKDGLLSDKEVLVSDYIGVSQINGWSPTIDWRDGVDRLIKHYGKV